MTTIIEHDVQTDGSVSSAITAIVAIAVMLFVVGIALYVFRVYPFSMQPVTDTAMPSTVNVNLAGTPPHSNPSVQ
jgi:Sec-independent protein secretion pathway component TatC